jgi:hypothetical protein
MYDEGLEMGRMARISLRYEESDLEEQILHTNILEDMNQMFGWGYFTAEDNQIYLTKPIFTSPYFIYGFLEGVMKIKLNIVESYSNRIVFDIQNEAEIVSTGEKAILDLIYNFNSELEKAKTIEEIANITVNAISKSIVYNQIGFGLIDNDDFKFLYTLPKNHNLPDNWTPNLDKTGITKREVKVGRTLFGIENRKAPIEMSEKIEAPIISTEMLIPINKQGKLIAFIHIQSNRPNAFKYREHKILETMVTCITNTMYRIET